MRTIILFVTTLLLLSCSILRPTQTTIETVRIEYREIVKDSLIFVSVPVEVVVKETFDSTSFLETSLAKSYVEVSGGKMKHSLENKIDPIKVKIQYKDRYFTKDSIKIKEIKVPYPVEKKLTWWQNLKLKVATYAFIALALILLMFLYKLKK